MKWVLIVVALVFVGWASRHIPYLLGTLDCSVFVLSPPKDCSVNPWNELAKLTPVLVILWRIIAAISRSERNETERMRREHDQAYDDFVNKVERLQREKHGG